jgi:hypothetical protein
VALAYRLMQVYVETDDTQLNSDPFFHTISIDEISNFINFGAGGGCAVNTATGNTLPVITAMNNNGVNIPISTPFTLTGTATDADNDALTYSWEQWDLRTVNCVEWWKCQYDQSII